MMRLSRRLFSVFAAALMLLMLVAAPGSARADMLVNITGTSTLTIPLSGAAATTQLTAECDEAIDPGHTFAWSSSNNSVATVSPSGLVTAVAPGTVTITASCQGTVPMNHGDGTFDITVTREVAAPTSVQVSIADTGMEINSTKSITATTTPANIPGSFNWSVASGPLTIPNASTSASVTVASGAQTGSAVLNVTFTPTDTTAYTGSSDSATIAVQNNAPALSVSADPRSFTAGGMIGAATARATNYTPTSYAWSISGNSVRFSGGATTATTTTPGVSFVTQNVSGTSTISCTVSGGTGTAPAASSTNISVQIPAPATPTLAVSASPSNFSASGESGTATATVTNYTPTSYVWSISGSSVRFSANGGTSITTTTNQVSFVTQNTDGTSTIYCTVSGGTGTAPTAPAASVYVDIPDPYLAVWLDHDTLTWLRPKTEAHAELHYPNNTVTNSSRIYWSSSHTSIATVSGVYDHLEHGYATAVVRAKSNGTTTITAYTSHQRAYDSASLLVTGYKHLPQSGQDTRLLYVEGAVLLLLLSAAGVVYARRRKDASGK